MAHISTSVVPVEVKVEENLYTTYKGLRLII